MLDSGILAGSVMDYPAVNYAPTEEEQTLFYTIAPGPYDDWYIEYAYSPGLSDAEEEAVRLRRSPRALPNLNWFSVTTPTICATRAVVSIRASTFMT